MSVFRNFSRGAKSTFCLSSSGCWRWTANGSSQNALPFQHHKENAPCYGNSDKKIRFFGSNAFFSLMLLFTPYKTTWLTAISNYCLAALLSCHRCLRSTVACGKTSVASLLLWKSTRFHDKKTLDSQKNTRLEKQNYTRWKWPENALQCQPQTLCNPL